VDGPGRDVESTLLGMARELVAQVRAEPASGVRAGLGDSLERDLGLDSLSRVELLLRAQRAFGVDLPQDTLERAETLRDLAAAIEAARARAAGRRSAAGGVPAAVGRPAQGPAGGAPAAGRAGALPESASTLLEVLDWYVEREPARPPVTLLDDDGEHAVSHAAMSQAARRVAAGLQHRGLRPRQTVAIMLPTSREYFFVYLGILLAGGVPVPIYPPARLAQIEEHVRRHARILGNARAAILVTVPQARAVARLLQAHVPSLSHVVSAGELLEGDGAPVPVAVAADDTAFIQYTSGSTGDPKGVVLTHANLLANLRAMGPPLDLQPDDVFVSWLPLYHDMGLIGAWLGTLYYGVPLFVMSPLAFLSRPVRWLRAIQAHRGTLSAAPNFAYELCATRIDDTELEGLDLSSWRLALNGAEAVLPETLARFRDRFAPLGLRSGVLTPVYGLAECSVGLAFPPPGRGPRIDAVRRDPFSASGQALPAPPDDPHSLRFVSCGRAIPGHALRIVDAHGQPLPERLEGRIEFRGPSATAGYLDNPAATARLIRDGWLDTGDRGYLADGEVYLTGREKDIVIRGGRNIYPHEVEEAVGEVEGVRKGCVAAFGSPDPASGTERLVVLAETRVQGQEARERLRAGIAERVLGVLGEPADAIVLAPPHAVLKTSSGKVRRSACREAFETGALAATGGAARWQFMRLGLGAAAALAARVPARLGQAAFGAWSWGLLALFAPPTLALALLAGSPRRAWAVSRASARAFLWLAGARLRVDGLERLPRDQPCVIVANHASYLDGMVLMAALPRQVVFVAKAELRPQRIAGSYLAAIGAEFVERFTAAQSVADAQRLEASARAGRSLMFFPEGTFTQVAGVRPFRLGAFAVAAAVGVPVVPVAIRGARAALPAGTWWPRPARISVEICEPIAPRGAAQASTDTFAASVALRDAARARIVADSGEPDLAG
jgi:1-acyl-sn-glycerol-3-phosphate acyltransferase